MIGGPEPLRTVLGPAGPCGVLFLRRNDFRIDFNMPLPLVPNPAEPEYPESVGPPSSREFNNDIYNRERIRIVFFLNLKQIIMVFEIIHLLKSLVSPEL